MNDKVREEVLVLINDYELECSVEEFKDVIDSTSWINISSYNVMSEDFIREFQDYISWRYISCSQHLSESFIREFIDKLNFVNLLVYQRLSEEFREELKALKAIKEI